MTDELDRSLETREFKILPHDGCPGYYGVYAQMANGKWENVLPNLACRTVADAETTIQQIRRGEFNIRF
jgi:hypothetical protein